nr:thioredoxin domain-containing protein [Winogradskyella forsetii]
MWCQALISIVSFQPVFNLESVLIVLLSFSFMTTFWLLASKILKDNKGLEKMKLDYFKFKRNFELFGTQLNNSKTINTKLETVEEIVFGNKNSALNIDFITNPLCGHCKPVHKLIEQILKSYSESTKLTIRFNINPENTENIAVKIAIRLMEIYDKDGEAICLKAMNAIYGDMSSEEWFKNWKFCSNPKQYLAILQKEYAWCTENSINFTPEILINGKSYPRVYDKGDLIFFIEDLEAQSQISTNNPEFSMETKS